ncbi:MAG TPA: phytanoyl-CoA dioxygenase family protein [Terriglobales bacterium]|nr:phytanoyl-CoA dioxygenase family protein [Terriglobales bacterium]
MQDLSLYHRPITSLFPQPATADAWQQYRLADEQVRSFRENGFLTGVRMLTDEQIEALRSELALMMDPTSPRELFYEYHSNESADPDRILFHALGAWRVGPAFHDLLWNPAFLVPASQLLGGAVRFWHDQLFVKPPHHGGVVAWHQDYSYWTRTRPLAHLTCWIGLDDSTPDNGCVQYVPGSHEWPDLPKPVLTGELDAIKQVLPEEIREKFNPVCAELKKGHSSFHHARTMHGSGANSTDRPRRAAVINVVLDGVRSDSDEPLLEGVPAIPKGQNLEGQFFPLLYRPDVIR